MLGRRGPGQYHFRLAGGFVADLHGRDLREEDFLRIWEPDERTQAQLALESARRRSEPLVIEARARGERGATVSLEIMLMPLTGPSGEVDRMMGFYQPTSPVTVLMGQPVTVLRMTTIRSASGDGASAAPRLRLAAMDGHQLA